MQKPTSESSVTANRPDAVLSVGQLNRLARQLLEDCFPQIWVEGEISNLSRPSSGHWYFTLKDSQAQVRCAMFRNRNIRIRFQPGDGTKVLVKGTISLYEARGEYQLIAEDLLPAGEGLLAAQFEMLKQKLQQEGLFDPAHKKSLPAHIAHIAVITSATGAAIRDIIKVLERRSPNTRVTLLPVPVQGEQAPALIVNALNTANALAASGKHTFDVILLGRGGGSMEDLWAFNDERVARAIYASTLPIVSAVGHEIDFTIADFVADIRAPTPSAGAELLSRDQREQLQQLLGWRKRLLSSWQRVLQQKQQQLHWQQKRLQHPGQRLRQWALRLDELDMRLRNTVRRRLREQHQHIHLLQSQLQRHNPAQQLQHLRVRFVTLRKQLTNANTQLLKRQQQRLHAVAKLLNGVSPLATLQRGYAIVSNAKGDVLRDSQQARIGDTVSARLTKGQLICTVETIIEEK